MVNIFTTISVRHYVLSLGLVINTTVCCYLSYRFQSPSFGVATLLPVIAGWLMVKSIYTEKVKRTNYVLSVICLVLTLGLYQSNLGCFIVIILILFMKLLLCDESQKAYLLLKSSIVITIISCVLYKMSWDVCLWARGVSASDYNGAGSTNILSLIMNMPIDIVKAYFLWISYFSFENGNYVFKIIRLLIIAILFVFVLAVGIKRLRKAPAKMVMYIIAFICIPMGANIALLLAPGADWVLWEQMTGPHPFTLALLFLLVDSLDLKYDKVFIVLAALILYGNIYAVGVDIDALSQGNISKDVIMNDMVSNLMHEEKCAEDTQYAFVGNICYSNLFRKNENWDRASNYAKAGDFGNLSHCVLDCYNGTLEDIGITLNLVDLDTYNEILASEELKNMPTYPYAGSIIQKDNIVIVKISEEY
ncbi:glucosyltransferase domain-containing protein [Pseudobutyrivibrio xylanivorans]|nr:glucosyltransferase domain-containing protein [Pseudobutyrivibrio xylanivorans]